MFNTAAFLLYIFITAYTPGPNNIMSMSNAARVGLKKALPFNLGILCGFVSVMLLCTLFSATLFALVPKIALPMKLAGAGYMLYLAYKIYRSVSITEQAGESFSFISGMLLQFINVKIIIYGVTAMSSYILPYFSEPLLLASFAVGLALMGFSANMCWALFGALFLRLFKRYQKQINTVMALLLAYCAVSLFM